MLERISRRRSDQVAEKPELNLPILLAELFLATHTPLSINLGPAPVRDDALPGRAAFA